MALSWRPTSSTRATTSTCESVELEGLGAGIPRQRVRLADVQSPLGALELRFAYTYLYKTPPTLRGPRSLVYSSVTSLIPTGRSLR